MINSTLDDNSITLESIKDNENNILSEEKENDIELGILNKSLSFENRNSDPRLLTQVVNNITKLSNNKISSVTYQTISNIITEGYDNNANLVKSTSLDILAVYLKGQKILYIESKTYCEQHLNILMLPAIILSVVSGLLAFALDSYYAQPIVIASFNAVNSFIISLISYLKLDAKAEAHKISAYNYDKLESLCEFNSGKILFFDDKDMEKEISNLVDRIETKVNEIKEINQFILPEYIRYHFPKLYSTNIFTLVKKLYIEEIILKNKLKNVVNKIIKKINSNENDKAGIEELENEQDKILEEIIAFRNQYLEIDKEFNTEINDNINLSLKSFSIMNWFKS